MDAELPRPEYVRYEQPDPSIARIVLDRAESRNALDRLLLYQLDQAFDRAMRDRDIKVVILAADGPHFSSGHDLRDNWSMDEFEPVVQAAHLTEDGSFGHYAGEHEYYLGLHWRWRNLAKPTIAEVQGKAIAGGLMLAWTMDLIVAAEDAQFSDPVVAFGVNGVEMFLHAWELGHRQAKEMLFTGQVLSADDCHRAGMVNHVVPREDLADFTLDLARRIASRPAIGLMLAKQSVNFSLDAQGQHQAVNGTIGMHHVGHAHARLEHGIPLDPSGFEVIRAESADTGTSPETTGPPTDR